MSRLTPQEKQDIIRFLEADKPLPDKYRFLLFDDKREVELVWNGKTNEVCNVVLPFQTIEQVDEFSVSGLDEAVEQVQRRIRVGRFRQQLRERATDAGRHALCYARQIFRRAVRMAESDVLRSGNRDGGVLRLFRFRRRSHRRQGARPCFSG